MTREGHLKELIARCGEKHQRQFEQETKEWLDELVEIAMHKPVTIGIPKPPLDQVRYLERINAASEYDPAIIIGGPRKR